MRKIILTIACCVLLAAVASYLTHPILDSLVTNEEHFWETQHEQDERVEKLRQEFDSHLKQIKDMIERDVADQPTTTLRLSSIKARLDGRRDKDVPANCANDECFDFYYFVGENFDTTNSKRKTILYINGGPGQIHTFDDRSFELLEKKHNVVYFHLRGAGLSAIPPSNKYDKYLRGNYAIEDLEKLRLTLLESRPASLKHWDAIYGYSYGTTLAQRYAKRYPNNVARLVLHAPIFRTGVTDKARSDQLRVNLRKIYSLIRSKDSVACSCRRTTSDALKIKVTGSIERGDDFCYMGAASDEKLIDGVAGLIVEEHDKLISKYGTLGFMVENLEQIKKLDPLDYPDEFYLALRKLTMLGAPLSEQSSLSSGEVENFVDSAITLAYYTSLERTDLEKERSEDFSKCSVKAPLFRNAPEESCKIDVYCPRLSNAKRRVKEVEGRRPEPRALYSFGLSDGIQHWVTRVLHQDGISFRSESCPTGAELLRFSKSDGKSHRMLRDISKKIGIVPFDDYCLWNPRNYFHEVPTLIITGGADLVTAGCEPEDFFDHGLTKLRRVLLEFPSWGHLTKIPFNIIDKFLTSPTLDHFSRDIRQDLTALGGTDRTPNSGARIECMVR